MNITEFDAVTKYIQNVETIYPAVEGRVKMFGYHKDGSGSDGSGGSSIVSASKSLTLVMTIALLNYIY